MHSSASYHALSSEGICRHFSVDPKKGLDTEGVKERRAAYGPNTLGRAKIKSTTDIFIDQFKSLLTALLAGAAVLSFLFNDVAEGTAILVVIIFNASIGFWAESKAVKSMAALRKMGRAKTRVLRCGQIETIADEEIVPGDIVLLEAGDIVTADIRLLEAFNVQCDESLLTGESVPVDKTTEVAPRKTDIKNRKMLAYKGTAVTRGSFTGIVVATGKSTELGEIAILSDTATGSTSPLEYRLQVLSEQLLLAVLILMVLLTVAGIIAGRDVLLMAKTGIALAVAAIPEGLPIVATLALARGMWKLAARNALVERLSAVETLGSVNVIFTDKTGTLTENKMTAKILVPSDKAEANGLEESGPVSNRALKVCALCYSGRDPENLSDPMEQALVAAAASNGMNIRELEKAQPRIAEEAFDPNIRMMATTHATNGQYFYAVKGAPEAVIAAASSIALTDGDQPLTDESRQAWLQRTTDMAQKGLRILALAEKTGDSASAAPYDNITFLGLICLEDPARLDASPAVKAAHDAGIRVVMATGDNAATASSIAADVGIVGSGSAATCEGDKLTALENISPKERDHLLSVNIYARLSPRQKLDLIELHQGNGAVVAMTGDGVNDAPALKKADVGIAMGVRGTEVAKEAADIILKDDAFASIVIAIQQGRIIFDNIRKFVIYLLSCNLSEVLVVTLCIVAGLPLPLLPLQILFLNLVTDVFPALALGFGKGDKEILNRVPRAKTEGLLQKRHWQAIISYSFMMTISVVAAFIWATALPEKPESYANTVAFLTLALGQLWHVFNMRSRNASILNNQITSNPFVWSALLFCGVILTFTILWQPLADVLHITPLDRNGWLVVIGASLLPLIIGQTAKVIATASNRRKIPVS